VFGVVDIAREEGHEAHGQGYVQGVEYQGRVCCLALLGYAVGDEFESGSFVGLGAGEVGV